MCWDTTDSCSRYLFVWILIYFNNINLHIVQIFLCHIFRLLISALRFNKVIVFKRFWCTLFKTNKAYKGTQWYGIWCVTWSLINLSSSSYIVTVRKPTENNRYLLVIYHVFFGQFNIVSDRDNHRKVWKGIGDSNLSRNNIDVTI